MPCEGPKKYKDTQLSLSVAMQAPLECSEAQLTLIRRNTVFSARPRNVNAHTGKQQLEGAAAQESWGKGQTKERLSSRKENVELAVLLSTTVDTPNHSSGRTSAMVVSGAAPLHFSGCFD